MVVVLDDLQSADLDSLALLASPPGACRAAVLVIGAYRDTEGGEPALRHLISEF